MTDLKEMHVDEDQLIQAVVDESDLPASVRGHLQTCRRCGIEKGRLEQDLAQLGHMAERFSPLPRKGIPLPGRESMARPRPWFWNWRSSLVAGMAAAAAIVIVVYGSNLVKTAQEAKLASLTQEIWDDDRLMTEIRELSDNALPLFCSDISGESDSDFDEEFIDFLVPSAEADIVSRKGGGVSC